MSSHFIIACVFVAMCVYVHKMVIYFVHAQGECACVDLFVVLFEQVCVSVYISIFVYLQYCIRVCSVFGRVCVCLWLRVRVHVSVFFCVLCVRVFVCMCVCVNMYMYTLV